MVFKVKIGTSCGAAKNKDVNENNWRKKGPKIERVYVALICFTTHCLSCITLEAGSRTSLGYPVTTSAAFNALFRRSYNLKIMILVTHVIAGLITTLMMTLADRYGIPYLYIPWLVNTMKGMVFLEGPALLNLLDVLLRNVTVPTAIFTLTTFFLYVEEFFIWNNAFRKFVNSWEHYHNEGKNTSGKNKTKLSLTRKKKLLHHGNDETNINTGIKKLKSTQKPTAKFFNKTSNRDSMNARLNSISNIIGDGNTFNQNQLLHMTG